MLQACAMSETVRAADTCTVCEQIVASFLPLWTKAGIEMCDFSQPFTTADRAAWLAAQLVTSCHGAQDFAAAVLVTCEA